MCHSIDKIYTALAHKLYKTNSESLGALGFPLKLFKINLDSVKNSKDLINTNFGVFPRIKKFQIILKLLIIYHKDYKIEMVGLILAYHLNCRRNVTFI